MESFLKADIFFFITTIALITVSLALIVVLIYLAKILSHFLYLSRKIREEGDEMIKDIHSLRTAMKDEGRGLAMFWEKFISFFNHKKSSRKSKTKKKDDK